MRDGTVTPSTGTADPGLEGDPPPPDGQPFDQCARPRLISRSYDRAVAAIRRHRAGSATSAAKNAGAVVTKWGAAASTERV
ncbi:hypothetical protein ACFRMQ_30115, partial [Kitasatospora sp. NPDC056783]|uniref:hypothetical protein n=1 Tax=Kitasatospora sp. NPDC056783 TaxID=3345943 RepID=UPI003685E9AB